MPRLTRIVLTLVLATLLLGTAAMAQSRTGSRSPHLVESASSDLFVRLRSLLAQWSKNGCEVDPNGRCLPKGSSLATGDNGCAVDPSGRCRASQTPMQTKNGCELDPDGRCVR
jgi:hypothetical protein